MKSNQTVRNILLTLTFTSTIFAATPSLAQSCYLADDGTIEVEDRSIPNQKKLWENCIDRKLAQLDSSHPNFVELGQEIGDTCTSSQIICK